MSDHTAASGHQHHVPSVQFYIGTFVFLLAFLVITVFFGYKHLGMLAVPVALTIAVIKATAVILNFMGVRFATRLTWIWACIGFVFLMLMFTIVTDPMTRPWMNVHGWTQ